MNKIGLKFIVVSSLMVFIFFGCATQKPMYYWGDYSPSLYKCHKDPNEKNLAEHQALLEKLIAESESRNLRIPPGVCGELGYIYMLQDNKKEAIRLFELEKKTYPEAIIFMDNLIQKVELSNKIDKHSEDSIDKVIPQENGTDSSS